MISSHLASYLEILKICVSDGPTDGPKDGLTDGPKDGLSHKPTDGPTDGPTNKSSCGGFRM